MVNPMLVNYKVDGTRGYHLAAGSPCINGGTSQGAPTTDYDGIPRPQGTPTSRWSYMGSHDHSGLFMRRAWCWRSTAANQVRLHDSQCDMAGLGRDVEGDLRISSGNSWMFRAVLG